MNTTPADPTDHPSDPPIRDTVGRGVGFGLLVILATLLCGGLLYPFSEIWWIFVLTFGVAQAVPLFPTLIYLHRRGHQRTIKGVMVVAGIGFLINATCAGIVFGDIARHGFN